MKVIEHLTRATGPLISYEIIPPQRGGTLRSLLELIDDLVRFRPPFIDITSHAAEVVYEDEAGRTRTRTSKLGKISALVRFRNSLAHGAARHAQCGSDLDLVELGAGGDLAGDDAPLQLLLRQRGQ